MQVIELGEYYIETGEPNNPWWKLTKRQREFLNLVLDHPDACENAHYGPRKSWDGKWIGRAGPHDHDKGWAGLERELVYYNPTNKEPQYRRVVRGLEILTAMWQDNNKRKLRHPPR
jgi:hypothetical protein